MNNAIRKNNQLLRHQQKCFLFFICWSILGPHYKQPELLVNMFVRFYSTLVKKTKLCILTITWWSQFFDFHEKRKQVHGKYSVHDIFFCITIYRSTNCTCKSKFQNDVTQFPQCKCHIKIIVLLSALFLLMGYQRISSIVGLILIHFASLESSWLSMLHNRVSLLKWHLFILSIDHFRIVSIRPGWAHSQRRVGVNITIPLHWPSCEWTLTLPIFLVFVRYQQ